MIQDCCCCCSVTQSCLTLLDPVDSSMPGLPVPHYLLEFPQVHVHCISDAIQPSHPLTHSSPFAFNLSQHQSFFQWVSSSPQVAKVLELQHQSFKWMFRVYFLWVWLVGSSFSPRDSQESSPTPQFKSINSSILSFLYGPTFPSIRDYWKTICLTIQTFVIKVMSLLFNMLFKKWGLPM